MTEADINDVLNVEKLAFGIEGQEIADLVQGLLNDPSAKPQLSLLAVKEEKTIGHILFTRARIKPPHESISAMILAPLAVIPEAQSQGVGGKLIKKGLEYLSTSGVDLVFVLGHPGYYPRHGFHPAGVQGFEAPYPIPEKNADAWMVQELRPDIIGKVRGQVKCADALDQPEYWRE